MNTRTHSVNEIQIGKSENEARAKLVSKLPVTERKLVLSGVSTAVLEACFGYSLKMMK